MAFRPIYTHGEAWFIGLTFLGSHRPMLIQFKKRLTSQCHGADAIEVTSYSKRYKTRTWDAVRASPLLITGGCWGRRAGCDDLSRQAGLWLIAGLETSRLLLALWRIFPPADARTALAICLRALYDHAFVEVREFRRCMSDCFHNSCRHFGTGVLLAFGRAASCQQYEGRYASAFCSRTTPKGGYVNVNNVDA